MGQAVSSVKQCCGLNKRGGSKKQKNELLTILIIGDRDVGKTTLIDNYIEEHTEQGIKEETVPLTAAPKNTDRLRIKEADQIFAHGNTSFSVKLNMVEVNGSLDVVEKQFRDSYYKQAKLVFILYNVAKVDSLYHAEKVWYQEIVDAVGNDKKRLEEMQVVLVGVNPEAREELQESDIYQPADDDTNEELFKKNTLRRSIRKGEGERASQRMKHKNSTRETQHFEVAKDRTKVLNFFSDVVQDYVLKAHSEKM